VRAHVDSGVSSAVTVPAPVIERAKALQTCMLKVLGFYFDAGTTVGAELARIRAAAGHAALASGLVSLGTLDTKRRARIRKTPEFYVASDARDAASAAGGIFRHLTTPAATEERWREHQTQVWPLTTAASAILACFLGLRPRSLPRRSRATSWSLAPAALEKTSQSHALARRQWPNLSQSRLWTLFFTAYTEVCAGGRFMYRDRADLDARFPALTSLNLARRGPAKKGDAKPEPADPKGVAPVARRNARSERASARRPRAISGLAVYGAPL